MNAALLLVESTLFLAFSVVLFRRERIYGFFFFLIYVYAIFSQIGYLYVPELSMSLYAYFGEAIWRPVTIFILCSGVVLFIFLRFASHGVQQFFHAHLIERLNIYPGGKTSPWRALGTLLIALMLLVETVIFGIKFNSISWENAQKEDVFSANLLLGAFILLVKLSVGTNLTLYCLLRQFPSARRNRFVVALLVTSIILFFAFTFRLGNRTDGVAVLLGIAVFETSQIRLQPRHFLTFLAGAAIVVAYLNFVESRRYGERPLESDLATQILVKDYFSPAHILFAAVGNELIMTREVIISNLGNSLMFLGQPYLQAPVMDTFLPGEATRSASYGFYPFTEGYLFAGSWGFLYNGIMLGTLLVLWRSLATTNSARFNNYLLALLGSMLVNLVRGQSSYYVKYLYTFVLPSAALYLCLANQRIRWRNRATG